MKKSHVTSSSSGNDDDDRRKYNNIVVYGINSLVRIHERVGSYRIHNRVAHNGFIFGVGDIVSLCDDKRIYFAQLKILVEDSCCRKYAALIWLIPTSLNIISQEFHPTLYTYGPQEETLYKIEELKFIMHAPSAFYKRFLNTVPPCTSILPTIRYKPKLKRKQ